MRRRLFDRYTVGLGSIALGLWMSVAVAQDAEPSSEGEETNQGTERVQAPADPPAQPEQGAATPRPEAAPEEDPAEPAAERQAPEDEISTPTLRLLRTLEAFHKDVKTVHAQFDQVRLDVIFEDRVESTGELWFEKPAKFRCDYTDPEPMINLILEDALFVYFPDLEQVDYWQFDSDEEREQQLHQLLIGFGIEVEKLVARYRVRSSEDDPALLAELEAAARREKWDPEQMALFILQPRPAFEETCPFRNLKVYIDKAGLVPEIIWYDDLNEAEMTLKMKKVETDVTIAARLFDRSAVIPSGTEYFDKRNLK